MGMTYGTFLHGVRHFLVIALQGVREFRFRYLMKLRPGKVRAI